MRGRALRLWLGAAATLAGLPDGGVAQGRPEVRVERADGTVSNVSLVIDRGFAAVPVSLLSELGWEVDTEGRSLRLSVPGEIMISLTYGSPFFRWGGVVLQLADAPYASSEGGFVPLQLLSDFFPRRLPDLYEFDGPGATLRAGDPARITGVSALTTGGGAPRAGGQGDLPSVSRPGASPSPTPTAGDGPSAPMPQSPSMYEGVRVVVIDAGHGGADPGVIGPSGIREKAVALGIATRVAALLRDVPELEVHMTRDDDTFVDLWKRGEIATDLKGDRPGVFVSIHANSVPGRRSATGFETYFLSEARTEHERRVSAIENAPLSFQGQDVDAREQPDIDFILRELRNLDHQHWSALLAEFVQDEIDDFHPGPNRGVKQGVLAVLTNALMPSVLVEVGYLSDQEEGRLLGRESFQEDAAEAIAAAVTRFFERYPPGSGFGGAGDGRRE